jgi:thioredoxin-like negative regulator of GroEL
MNKILKMSAPWCKPCSQMDIQLEKLKDQLGDCLIEHVNIDVSFELARSYNVRSIPTLIKLNEYGNEVDRNIGSITDAKLLEFLL